MSAGAIWTLGVASLCAVTVVPLFSQLAVLAEHSPAEFLPTSTQELTAYASFLRAEFLLFGIFGLLAVFRMSPVIILVGTLVGLLTSLAVGIRDQAEAR